MSMLLKEIERIEALAENKRDATKLVNFWKMYALELRDEKNAEIESLRFYADCYQYLRNKDLSEMNTPCIAIQKSETSGTFVSGEDADNALKEAMWTPPSCDKCGAEITTGFMAAFCPNGKDCEFYVEGVEAFYPSDKSCHICNGDCSDAPTPVIGCPHSATSKHLPHDKE